jgi:hypothetical protein
VCIQQLVDACACACQSVSDTLCRMKNKNNKNRSCSPETSYISEYLKTAIWKANEERPAGNDTDQSTSCREEHAATKLTLLISASTAATS